MVASDTTDTVATQVVLVADGALTFRWSFHFPQNNLSPVEIDWAAKAVDSDIIALVGKSTSDRKNTGYCLEGEAETGSTGITTSTAPVIPEEAYRTTSHYLATKHRRDRPIASPRIA